MHGFLIREIIWVTHRDCVNRFELTSCAYASHGQDGSEIFQGISDSAKHLTDWTKDGRMKGVGSSCAISSCFRAGHLSADPKAARGWGWPAQSTLPRSHYQAPARPHPTNRYLTHDPSRNLSTALNLSQPTLGLMSGSLQITSNLLQSSVHKTNAEHLTSDNLVNCSSPCYATIEEQKIDESAFVPFS